MLEEGYNDFRIGEIRDVSRGAAMRLLVTGWYREDSRHNHRREHPQDGQDRDRRSIKRRQNDAVRD